MNRGLLPGVRQDPTFDNDPVTKQWADLKTYQNTLTSTPALSSTDTFLVGRAIDADTLAIGKLYRATVVGTTNGSSTATFRLRFGTLGTTADALLHSTAPVGTAAVTFKCVFEFIPLTLGVAGTARVVSIVTMHGLAGSAAGTPAAQATPTIDTTRNNILSLTASVGTGTLTIYVATVEAV